MRFVTLCARSLLVSLLGSAVALEAAPIDPTALVATSSVRSSVAQSEPADDPREAVTAFYQARSFRPVWIEQGKLNPDGIRLVQAILTAQDHGIDIADLDLLRTEQIRQTPGEELFAYDRRLTILFLRYARALRVGRVTPEEIGMAWAIPRPAFDTARILDQLQRENPGDILAGQPPPHSDYWRLVAALAHYRQIDARGGWPTISDGQVLDLGQPSERVYLLRERLAREGYLLPDGDMAFDEAIHQAVRAFQSRHGLLADGRVGSETLSALNVSTRARVRQIELNLERWRWIPRDLPVTRLEVNVAAAELRVLEKSEPTVMMRAIVGSPRHRTPMLQSAIQAVIINPPWNVPTSITVNEIIPRLRREPDYLLKQDIRILDLPYDPYGLQVDWKHLPAGTRFRLQQKPGPINALGRLKFDLPNRFDVYLHDTPGKSLFANSRRTLSHGCIRLQYPARLATYLLGDSEDWANPPNDETRRIALRQPLPVYLLYWTAFVGDNGQLQFRDDVYGHDRRLQIALANKSQRDQISHLNIGGCKWS